MLRARKGLLPAYARRVSLLVLLTLTVGLAILLSAGPSLQWYLLRLANADAHSVYQSAYQDSIIKFPSLATWLKHGATWPYLLMGLAVACSATLSRYPRSLFGLVSVTALSAMMALDIMTALVGRSLSVEFMFTNLVFNLAGAVLIAFFVVLSFAIIDIACSYMAVPKYLQRPFGSFFFLMLSAICSTTIYYAADYFYRPIPAKIELGLAFPSSGVFRASGNPDSELKIIPDKTKARKATWVSALAPISVSWAANQSAIKYSVSVGLYKGCYGNSSFPEVDELLKLNDVRDLSVSIDSDNATFISTASREAQFTLKSNPFKYGWHFFKGEDGEKVAQELIFDSAKLSFQDAEGEFDFRLSAVHASSNALAPRLLKLKIDGASRQISIPIGNVPREESVGCKLLSTAQAFQSGESEPAGLVATVRLKIRPIQELKPFEVDGSSEVTVVGSSGAISLSGLGEQNVYRNDSVGEISFLSVTGTSIAYLRVDNSAVSVAKEDWYGAIGSFSGMHHQIGDLRFVGTATSLWLNQVRANPTKWEKAGTALFAALAGVTLSLFGIGWKLLAGRVQANRAFSWLAAKRRSTAK